MLISQVLQVMGHDDSRDHQSHYKLLQFILLDVTAVHPTEKKKVSNCWVELEEMSENTTWKVRDHQSQWELTSGTKTGHTLTHDNPLN